MGSIGVLHNRQVSDGFWLHIDISSDESESFGSDPLSFVTGWAGIVVLFFLVHEV